MDELKKIARALGLADDAPVDKILGAVADLKRTAMDAADWEGKAHALLSKSERTERVLQENVKLRAKVFMQKAVADFKIDTAEAEVLEEIYVTGDEGEATVKKLLATRSKRDFLTRMTMLTGREVPSDPLAEIESRAAEFRAKDPKLSKSEAHKLVLDKDPDLALRYRSAIVKGAGGAD